MNKKKNVMSRSIHRNASFEPSQCFLTWLRRHCRAVLCWFFSDI